jgi:hypothetical protein
VDLLVRGLLGSIDPTGGNANGSSEEKARYGSTQIQTQAKERYEEESHQENTSQEEVS